MGGENAETEWELMDITRLEVPGGSESCCITRRGVYYM